MKKGQASHGGAGMGISKKGNGKRFWKEVFVGRSDDGM
jgi:hypothetical protein